MKMSKFPFKIEVQGAIIVNSAIIVKKYKDVILISMDLESKYAYVQGLGSGSEGPSIIFEATEDTLHIKRKLKDSITHVSFPKLGEKWTIFATWMGRYNCDICFIKEE